jgi:hypothetical protein
VGDSHARPNGLAFSGRLEEIMLIDRNNVLALLHRKIALIQPLRCNAMLDGDPQLIISSCTCTAILSLPKNDPCQLAADRVGICTLLIAQYNHSHPLGQEPINTRAKAFNTA